MAILQQSPWADNHYPKFDVLEDLQDWVKPLIEEEKVSSKLSSKGNNQKV